MWVYLIVSLRYWVVDSYGMLDTLYGVVGYRRFKDRACVGGERGVIPIVVESDWF